MDNHNLPTRPISFLPGSNFAFKRPQPNKMMMTNLVMQKKYPAPQTWGQVYMPPPTNKRNAYGKTQTYIPPFDKSDYWIKFPPMNGYQRTPAPLN